MILRFFLGIAYSLKFFDETPGRIDCIDVQSELVMQRLLHFLELVLAQHSVVDENAGEPRLLGSAPGMLAAAIAQSAIDEHGRNRRIHST